MAHRMLGFEICLMVERRPRSRSRSCEVKARGWVWVWVRWWWWDGRVGESVRV